MREKAQPLKIAISLLSGISYGGVTYFRNFIPALMRADKKNEYHLFIPPGDIYKDLPRQDNFLIKSCPQKYSGEKGRFFWEQFLFPLYLNEKKVDVLYTAKNNNIFRAKCKTIIAIRNMEPIMFHKYKNHWMLDVKSFMRRLMTQASIGKADCIVAVSDYVRESVKKSFHQAAGKNIEVVHNGNPVRRRDITDVEGYKRGTILLTTSKFVTYANQLNLIRAWGKYCRTHPEAPVLVMAGGILDHKYYRRILRTVSTEGLEEKTKILGLISHDELLRLYARAKAFVYPSTLESCPQTLIEAMTYGLPVATTTVGPMREICRDAALYFDPYDTDDIVRSLTEILDSDPARRQLHQRALCRAKDFCWEDNADKMVDIFEKTAQSND